MTVPRIAALAIAAIALSIGAARADIVCEGAWSPATDDTAKPGSVFLTIANTGAAPDTLLKVSSPAAMLAQVHVSRTEGDAERMKRMKKFEIAPGETVRLDQSDMHVMLVKLKQPLQAGQSFPLSLVFEKAGTVETSVTVRGAGMKHGH